MAKKKRCFNRAPAKGLVLGGLRCEKQKGHDGLCSVSSGELAFSWNPKFDNQT